MVRYLYGYGYEIYMMEFETPGFHIFKFKCSQIQVLENKNSFLLPTFSRQRRKVRAQLNLPQKRKLWIQEGIHPTLKIEKSATKNVDP